MDHIEELIALGALYKGLATKEPLTYDGLNSYNTGLQAIERAMIRTANLIHPETVTETE